MLAKEVLEFDDPLFMVTFDIESLFTNICLTKMLILCVQNLYRNQTHVGNLNKTSFINLFKITMFELFLIFDVKYYEDQCDDLVKGSPLRPTLANVFVSF